MGIAMKNIAFFSLLCLMPIQTWGKTPVGMVLVPAGEFTMGTDDSHASVDQRPAHQVYVDAFYIDKHEVTNAQFEEFILAGGYKKRKYWTEASWEFIQKERVFYSSPMRNTYRINAPLAFGDNAVSTEPDHPVIGVSWYEADAYAKWVGKRLPTEAEWEKAARGTRKKRIYPWGNKMDFEKLNYFPHQQKLMPAGSFSEGKSPYGVLDMAGSVWEWCSDWYAGIYSQGERKNPKGPARGELKVLRGGGWASIRLQLRCANRYAEKPTHRAYTVGFRCVKDVE